jgi:protein PhnA
MTDISELSQRSNSKCEFCGSPESLSAYEVAPKNDSVLTCSVCLEQILSGELDANHWRCLNDSMWSEFPAVQVMSWRLLTHLKSENWATDLLSQMYLEDATMEWAKSGITEVELPKDSNGNSLNAGDTVTLIKDLDVKGANFTAKRGTIVRNISLSDNSEHIEGRVNGTKIVLVTKFLKKA